MYTVCTDSSLESQKAKKVFETSSPALFLSPV